MEFRSPSPEERHLLLELAKIAGMTNPKAWVDTLKVREMNDGGMGSLSLSSEGTEGAGSPASVTCQAAVQFTDEDGVEVVASLNASESGVPFELDIWKTNFAPLRRIPTIFRPVEG
jgi:uncharacterized protein DUF6984